MGRGISRYLVVGALVFLVGVCLAPAAAGVEGAMEATLESDLLQVTFDRDEGVLEVTDKRTGTPWRQVRTGPSDLARATLVRVDAAGRTLEMDVPMPALRKGGAGDVLVMRVTASLSSTEPDLRLVFAAHPDGEWDEAGYPLAFRMTGRGVRVVLPHCEGLLTPAREDDRDYLGLPRDWFYSGYGAYCACLGLTDLDSGEGLLLHVDTPELAGYDLAGTPFEGTRVHAPTVFWRASKHRFDRDRSITYTFTREGGYVALAREYGRHYRARGLYKSLRDKARELPATNQMVGAPVWWLFDTPENTLALVRMMREDGIDRSLIEVGHEARYWGYFGETAKVEALKGLVTTLNDLGYVTSCYDQYRDCFAPDPQASVHVQMNADGYPDACVRLEDGGLRHGWPPGYVLNPVEGIGLARRHIPADLQERPYRARFIDCVGTCAVWECEDWSEAHPLDAYAGLEARRGVLEYALSLGLLTGTEGAMDCMLPRLHWLETPMSLVAWTAADLKAPGYNPVPVSEKYAVNLSTRYRIPFYSLVHHAEVVSTWRWEDSLNRLPQYWQDKNLWCVLYGNPPLFVASLEYYTPRREAFAHCYRYVCGWTQRVAWAELVRHRFVSPDWKVQESLFSTGDGVVVNFGTEPYSLPDGAVVGARSYLTFTGDADRKYSPPPVPEMDYVAACG